jgi:dephospho-CoA kinase
MLIAVTGKIATGKTTLAQKLAAKHQGAIIEVDKLNELAAKAPLVKSTLQKHFQISDLSTTQNRATLRELVFTDLTKLKLLESILHPSMRQIMYKLIEQKLPQAKTVIVAGALWREFEFHLFAEQIFTTSCPKNKAWQRVQKRNPAFKKEYFELLWARQEDW